MSDELIPAPSPIDAQFDFLKRLVLDSVQSPHSKMQYEISLNHWYKWYWETWRGPIVKAMLNAYKSYLVKAGYAPSTINCRLAAIKKMTAEAADNLIIDFQIAFSIARVKRVPNLGVRKGLWLDKEGVMELLRQPDTSTRLGSRDYAMLCIFVGCGLRREELRLLRFERIQMCEGRWCIVDLVGKGRRVRTIPMPAWAKTAVDDYAMAMGIKQTGLVFRHVRTWTKRQEGAPLTTERIWQIVREAGSKLGIRLRPHDLRRTHAKLAYKGGAPLAEIQFGLGHSNLTTTERYLGLEQDLRNGPADYLGLDPHAERSANAPARQFQDALKPKPPRPQDA